MAAQTETDPEIFRLSSLVGEAGVGSNGEILVNTLLDHYPPELQAALEKRINEDLDAELDDKARGRIAKIAGVKEIEDAHVRGGHRRSQDAVVTYAYVDERGEVWKGCFPYPDLDRGSSDAHVSQRDSLAKSEAASRHREAQPLRAAAEPADPFALLDADANELVALMEANPERAEQVKALEGTRSKPRKTVMEWEPAPSEEDGGSSGESS